MRNDYILYSESQGRLVVTINPKYASATFEFGSIKPNSVTNKSDSKMG